MWAILAILVPAGFALCTNSTLREAMSECDNSGNRLVVYYWGDDCAERPPDPLNLPCDYECEAGAFVTTNAGMRSPSCGVCPYNTYSLGGGRRFLPPFPRVFHDFNPRCISVRHNTSALCPSWHLSPDSLYLQTGQGAAGDRYKSELVGNFFVRKPGKMSLSYRKIATRKEGRVTGVFRIEANGFTIWEDSSVTPLWQTVDFQLSARDYEMRLIHDFTYLPLPAVLQIREILIPGLSASAETCSSCPFGTYSRPGARECFRCKGNSYLDIGSGGCVPCSSDKYAIRGSVGWESCTPRRACSEQDYRETAGACLGGIRDIWYEWVDPILCDYQKGGLPQRKNETCEACEQGYLLIPDPETQQPKCAPCAPGSYASHSTCLTCPTGFYAPKVLNYTQWHPLPPGFSTTCFTPTFQLCEESEGWVGYRHYLASGRGGLSSGNTVVLLKEVNVTMLPAYVEVRGRGVGQGVLYLEVDNQRVEEWEHSGGEQAIVGKWNLSKGLVQLTWSAVGVNYTVAIDQVLIVGAEDGVATECAPCPEGSISPFTASACKLCPRGFSSSPKRSECTQCPPGSFTTKEGEKCRQCPNNTVSSADSTACVSPPLLSFQNETFINLQPLADSKGVSSICSQTQVSQFCTDTFFGPIPGSKGVYYLSILNPGDLKLVNAFPVDDEAKAYAFGIYVKRSYGNDQGCEGEGEMQRVSLGSQVKTVQFGEGLWMEYGNGSQCGERGKFGSGVRLVCDNKVDVGWPVILREEDCYVEFQWANKHACPICPPSVLHNETSLCSSGQRLKSISAPAACTWPFPFRELEPCSELAEFLSHIETIVGTLVLLTLLALSVWGCKSYVKEKRKLGVLLHDRGM